MATPTDIIRAATKHRMFQPGDRALVAVSGGADSVAMLHALHTRADELGITLHVAHLNHGIRGEESDADEEFVRRFAGGLALPNGQALPITVERVSVPQLRREMRAGEEEAARAVRYRFLRKTATELDCDKIAVGHTADDRAETVLLNILRGTGIEGLGSIRPVSGNIIRPLIDTWRTEIEDYIAQHGLEYRIDSTNLDTTYARNRVRHELIPLLERGYNPQVKLALVRLTEIASAQADLIERLGAQAALAAECRSSFDARLISELPQAIQSQIVRAEIERAKGDLADVAFEQIERVVEALRTGENFVIALPTGEVYAERHGDDFRIGRAEAPPEVPLFDSPIAVPGRTEVPEIGLTLLADVRDKVETTHVRPNVALIDARVVRGDLRIRNARPGDRIRPFGMRGTKKLQDVFVDKKVPVSERALAAVVVDNDRVLWVVGVVASETARVTDATEKVIRLAAMSA